MIYTKEEKQRLDNLLEAFQGYIAGHKYFDVAYSDKLGFLCLDLCENQTILDETKIETYDDLLVFLFDEIADDVRDERVGNGDDTDCLYQTEIAALRVVLDPILNSLKEDKEHCLTTLEDYINQCNVN